MASFIGTTTLTNPLSAPLDANGFSIINGSTYEALRSETVTLAVPATSGFDEVVCEDNLLIDGKALRFGAPTTGTTSIKIEGAPGYDVEIADIPAGAAANVIGYDTATKKLTYFATPSGGGTVTGVAAGTNITVDNTNPAVPVVGLLNPLTAQLNIGEQNLIGSSTDGATQSASIDEKTTGGITAYDIKQYTDTDPATNKSCYVNSEAQPTFAQHYTNFTNNVTGQIAEGGIKAETNQFSLYATATDPTASSSATRVNLTSGGQIQDNTEVTGAGGIYTKNSYAITGIGVNHFNRVQASGADNRHETLVQAAQAYNNITYGVGATTAQNENVVDAGKSRFRNRYITTGVTNTTIVDTTALSSQIAQYYQSGATSRSGTLTADANGYSLSSDNAVNVFSGTASDITLTSVRNTIVNMGNGGLQVNNTTATGTNPAILALRNTNTTGGITNPVKIEFYKNDSDTTASDVIMEMSSKANSASFPAGVDYTRIRSIVRGTGANNVDGSLQFQSAVNIGAGGEPAIFMDLNGGSTAYATTGAIEVFKPIALSPNATGVVANLTLDASTANGTGAVEIKTKNATAGSGAGLLLTGNTLTAVGAGGSAGLHLCLTINGVVYKIALLNA